MLCNERNQLNLKRRRALRKLSLMQHVIDYRKTLRNSNIQELKRDYSTETGRLASMMRSASMLQDHMDIQDYNKICEIHKRCVGRFQRRAEENRRMLRILEAGNKKTKYFKMSASEFRVQYQEAVADKYSAMASIKRHIQKHKERFIYIKKRLNARTLRDNSGNIVQICLMDDNTRSNDILSTAKIAKHAIDVITERALTGESDV